MAKMMRPRLISKEQAKIVAKAGGVICVWTHLADTLLEYAHNIRAMVDVVGTDHVCIGTDTELTPAYRPGGDLGPNRWKMLISLTIAILVINPTITHRAIATKMALAVIKIAAERAKQRMKYGRIKRLIFIELSLMRY